MNAAAWINLVRGVFNATKVWIDPAYEREKDEIVQDFQQNYIQPFLEGLNGVPQPVRAEKALLRKPFRIMLYVLLALASVCMILGGH